MKRHTTATSEHLYLQVAEGVEKMITEDVLRIGDKLPSVRVLSQEYGISMGTAFQAYYHLEGRGLIESRPKSGYYVRFNQRRLPDLPHTLTPSVVSHDVSVKEMIASIYADIVAKDVINFAIAAPNIALLPKAKLNKAVMHALRDHPESCISYENPQGNAELRQQIAKLAFNWGGKIKPDEVTITSGCLDAITTCLKAVTEYGDTVAVESPTYFGTYQAIESMGLKVVEISSHPETGMDLECLEKVIKKFPIKACVTVPNFNNPSGSCMPDSNKKKLVELISKHQIPLIEDDIYGELYFGKSRPRTCKYYDRAGLVMYCSSLSKALAPGYRIGWVLGGKFSDDIRQIKRIRDISCPTLTQVAMAYFLKNGRYEYHLKQIRKALHTQSLRYLQAIIEYFPAETKVSRPQGGFTLWLELPKKVDGFKLRAEAMKQNISLVPGKIFSANCNYSNFIRISFGKPWCEDMDYGLMQLGKMVHRMAK